MAPTLLSSPAYHHQAPPTSPSLQVPNVFIVPPEEEGPAWLCFDATKAPLQLATAPDITFLDNALTMFHTNSQTPFFHPSAGGPFASHNAGGTPAKSSETRSVLDDLMDGQYPDSDDEMEIEMGMAMEQEMRSGGGRESGNDSEVVEVIKLRRHGGHDQHYPRESPPKASKSFKSRASKAFRSLRNVGKGTIRLKPKAQDVFPSDSRELPSRSNTPTMSRRSSAVFSQLFSPPANSARSSVSSFEAARSQTQAPPVTSFSPPSHHSHESHSSSRPSLTSPSSMTFDHQDIRSPSPTPSTQTKSNRRRFSMLSLQRMFSFSGDEFSEGLGSPTSMSRDSTGPSSTSSAGPDTPTDESTPLPSHHFAPEDYVPLTTPKPGHSVTHEQGDISFEMRLDSLHFESLSFDADRF